MKWEKKAVNPGQVKEISARFGCDLLAASVMARRGIFSGEQAKFFLEDDLRYLRNPFELPGMEDAVERILAARDEGEKVLVFGDSDVDGITGTVLLTEYLESLGMDVSWRIPGGEDPYGLTIQAVDEFAGDSGTLIITVDCGISRLAEVQRANELCVDVIVTDHHEPQEQLPQAIAVLNPKLKGTPYPFKDLSGCAVAFKLVCALRFAEKTDLYAQPICLVNTRPVNDAWIVEAARLRNLVVTQTLTETIVPGMVGIGDTRIPAFLEGQQILAWDAGLHKRTMAKLFGTSVEIEMLDIAGEIAKEIPQVAGKSLLRIKELSSIAKYCDSELSELDVFANLFRSFIWKREKIPSTDESRDLQLAALGTIADIMPLRDENRIIVKGGLKSLAPPSPVPGGGPRPGIRELLDKLDLSGSRFDAKDISWKICPVINAARRMGSPETAARLFFEKDPAQREKLATQLVGLNRQRKVMEEQIWASAEPMAYRSLEGYGGNLVMAHGEEINKGVTGLVAGRLARHFQVPAIVVSVSPDVCTGSIRSARGYNIGLFLEQCADLFIDCGGHEFAGGFSLKSENWETFESRIKTAAAAVEFPEDAGGDTLEIDAELPPEYLSPDLLRLVDCFAPYGNANEPLAFMAKRLKVEELDIIGRSEAKHLRLTLCGGRHKWPALYWDAAVRVEKKEFGLGDTVDAVFNIQRDWYKGIATPQMIIRDLRRSE